MPVEASPEWLPPGWTCEFRFQKTGRKITQYVNWATGQKFCTKDDLIRYTKMESKQCDDKMPKPTADSQTAVKEDERPEWLPKNWLMEVKTRKSGVTTGRQCKIYIDPSTRSKFYSKPKVLRFLNQAEQKVVIENSTVDDLPSGSTKEVMIKGNANGVQSNSAAVNANERPEWLPENWLVEVKTRKSGITTGRQCKIYIDPSTRSKFYSKPQVLRFLNQAEQKAVIENSTVDDLPSGSTKEVMIKGNANGVQSNSDAVNANERPEWLPENWLVEVKTRKSGITTGRQCKIYIDPSTRSKFYSKPQVLRFLNQAEQKAVIENSTVNDLPSGSTKEVMIKGNANGVQSNSAAVNANECPEWLPDNWLVEVKTRKSGLTTGRQVKIYVDPLTGLKFYSKPQALRFLNRAEQRKKNPKQIKRASHSRKEIVIEKSTVDDLPSGWIKEVKKKRNAHGVYKYTCYTDPARGYVFPSKKAVLRYLETGELAVGVFLPEKHIDDQILNNRDESVVIETTTEDDLPSGWIKEVQIKRSANGFRTYLYYSDPTRRYVFHSKKAVLRYLETGAMARGLFLAEKNNDDQTLTKSDEPQLPAAKRKKVEHLTDRQQLVTGGETSDRSILSDLETETFKEGQLDKDCAEIGISTSPTLQIPQKEGSVYNASKRNPEAAENSSQSSMNSKDFGKSKNKKELDLPSRISNRLDRLEPEQVASGLEHVKPCQNEAIEVGDVLGKQPQILEIEKTGDTKSEVHSLISSDPCLEFKTKALSGGVLHENAADKGPVSTPPSCVLEEKNLGKARKERKRRNTGTKTSSNSKKIKKLDLPCLFSKQLARLETEPVSNGVSTEIPIPNATRKSGKNEAKPPRVLVDEETRQLNVGPKASLTNQASPSAVNPEINNISCHEDKTMLIEQPQMSGTQKGSDSKSEVEPLFCSDPCLAFAIKTLTGAIPLEDAINEGLVSFPVAHIQQQKNLADTRIEHSRYRKTLFNSTRSKKDGGLHQRSPKQVAVHAPELVENCFPNEQILNFAYRKSCDSKAIRNADLTSAELTEKSPQQLEIGPRIAYGATLFHDESSNKSKYSCNIQTVSTQMNNENPGQGSAIPMWSSWSGPSFQSPFRAVAGSSPVNDSFAFQRNLPDHRLPTFYQSDTPSQVDRTRQPVMHQQFPLNPLFLPPGNVSLPSSSTIGAQQSSRKGKRKYQKKVKS